MASQKFSAVVFDFGGVVISPITRHIAELADHHGVTMEELLVVVMGPREVSTVDHPWHRAERGEIGTAEFQEAVGPWAAHAGITLNGNEFAVILNGQFDVYDEVVRRIVSLRRDGYRTALLTNSFQEFRHILEARVDFTIFDEVVDSSEVGCRKPEPRIYQLTTERLGVPASEIVYLDDFLANVEGAKRAGWTAVHVHDPRQALADLDALLA